MIIIVCRTIVIYLYNKIMNKDLLKSFGQEVKRLRLERNLSQEAFAEIVGVHRTYIGMIERGEKNITLENIFKLSTAFGISISELFKNI